MEFDLLVPAHSYFYGFALADGHLEDFSRNRGKLRIELFCIDVIHKLTPVVCIKG